uniref:Uncharacterized protein n=1 Tax=Panagrolaimus sp. ES5 TaxID=591445 RepID=A0AC34FEB8_9BILA
MANFIRNILQKLFSSSSPPELTKFKNNSSSCLPISSNILSSSTTIAAATTKKHVQLGFPKPILYYLKKNAKPKLLLKLMKSSKLHFSFKEFPFFATHFLKTDKAKWIYFDQGTDEIKALDLENLSKPLWITNGIDCSSREKTTIVSNLLSKTFICDIKYFRIVGRVLSMKQLKTLNSKNSIEYFTLYNSHVECCEGRIVKMDEIIRCLPNVKTFLWLFSRTMVSMITPYATRKLIDSLNPSILTSFHLMNVPETFDFKLFAKFMKKHPWIEYYLEFDNISLKFSKMLQSFVDKLVKKAAAKKYRPIRIRFPGQTFQSQVLLEDFYQSYSRLI